MAISSSTDIGNLALDLLNAGTVEDIESPTNANESLLNRWYDVSRRKLLREHPWNFASKRVILAPSATAPAWGFATQFPLPNDFIRILSIQDGEGNDISQVSFQVENGSILYDADANQLRLRYVHDLTNVALFDPMFVDLLAHELALVMASKVTGSNTDIQRIAELMKARTAMAKAIDGQERPPTRRQVSRARNARLSLGNKQTNRIVW